MFALILMTGLSGRAHAILTIEITQGVEGALPVAIVPFAWDGASDAAPLDISRVIEQDLQRSGRFSPLPREDFLARPSESTQINFRNWRVLGIESLVVGKISAAAGGYTVQFQLFDVFRSSQLTGYTIRTTASELRRTAHQISDIIYETLLGEPGAFATRIAYVTELRASNGSRRFSLQVADADGHNPRPVLNSVKPLMSPSWSPDGRRLAYVSFESNRPAIYIQNLETGKRQRIAAFRGLNGAPAWSPDGTRLAVVLSREGSADIYVMELGSRKLRRLTKHYAIDTEPVWTPDGSAIVFTSDRGGKPQLYRVRASGGGRAERLTFEGSYNARAAISPNGRTIAFVHGEGNVFRVAVMDIETGAVQVLTDTFLDESPSFAPNGSMILYATVDGGKGVLSAVSVDGRVHQRLALQEGNAREPAWSPYGR